MIIRAHVPEMHRQSVSWHDLSLRLARLRELAEALRLRAKDYRDASGAVVFGPQVRGILDRIGAQIAAMEIRLSEAGERMQSAATAFDGVDAQAIGGFQAVAGLAAGLLTSTATISPLMADRQVESLNFILKYGSLLQPEAGSVPMAILPGASPTASLHSTRDIRREPPPDERDGTPDIEALPIWRVKPVAAAPEGEILPVWRYPKPASPPLKNRRL